MLFYRIQDFFAGLDFWSMLLGASLGCLITVYALTPMCMTRIQFEYHEREQIITKLKEVGIKVEWKHLKNRGVVSYNNDTVRFWVTHKQLKDLYAAQVNYVEPELPLNQRNLTAAHLD